MMRPAQAAHHFERFGDSPMIVGSANVIAYVMKESWLARFEEGCKYPL